ncbi:MAG: efflux RND transporter permease subunit [Gammaproteobacteria bacterium]|nr:efflux RND transporter permease subunit [Gammaproteobacteria bacterium]
MYPSDLAIQRPVFTIVLSLLLVVLGLAAFDRLPIREYPDIDPPIISISTVYVGAAADVIERDITQQIESAVSGVEGIKRITSTSRDEVSSVTIEFELSRDVDAAANDVRDKLARVRRALPDEAEESQVSKADADSSPILWMGLSSPQYSGLELTDYAVRNLQDRFSSVPGVASVTLGGGQFYAMRVWLNREAMVAYGVTANDVVQAIRAANVELPAGRIESLQREFSVRLKTRLLDKESFGRIVVYQNQGRIVRLNDIAKINLDTDTNRREMYLNGKGIVGLGIVKQSKANTLDVSKGVRAELAKVQDALPDALQINVIYDSALFIEESIHEVVIALGIAILLVVGVIYGFLGNWRATLIPAVAIPVSVIASFMVLGALGFTINILTLLAFVLAIGLVVDDSIIVLENVYRRMEQGESPLVAAYRGSRQITFAVIATTLVLVSVFLPLSYMQGNVGRLFTEFGVALAAAVLFSSVVALTLTPMMCALMLQSSQAHQKAGQWFAVVNDTFARWVETAQHYRGRIFIVSAILALGAVGLYMVLPAETTPIEDRSIIYIRFSTPDGSSLEYTRAQGQKIEKIVNQLKATGELGTFFFMVAPSNNSIGEVNSGLGIARLVPIEQRTRSQEEIKNQILPQLLKLPGVQAFAISPMGYGQNSGAGRTPLQVVIGSSTYAQAETWANQLLDNVRENSQLLNPDIDYKTAKPVINVSINRDKAALAGISAADVAETLQVLYGSRTVSTFIDRNETYDVILQLPASQRRVPQDIGRSYIRALDGQMVPLSNYIDIAESATPKELSRVNRLPAVTLSAALAPNYALGDALNDMQRRIKQTLPADAAISYSGLSLEYYEASGALWITFGLALIVVFLVLAAQFESWIHPLTIMLTVPIAITGGLLSLWLAGISLNIFSQIGLLMLVGLVAKNGILIVEFANQLRGEGYAVADAALQATKQRFRPIMMTTIATILGAVPLVLSSGAGAESRSALAIVIIGGMMFATFVSLFLIPAVYIVLARFVAAPGQITQQLQREGEIL